MSFLYVGVSKLPFFVSEGLAKCTFLVCGCLKNDFFAM